MKIKARSPHRYYTELRNPAAPGSGVFYHEDVTSDLVDLIYETYTAGILSETLSPHCTSLECRIRPIWLNSAVISAIDIELHAPQSPHYRQRFTAGPWSRRTVELIEQQGVSIVTPPLQLPIIHDGTLASCGIRHLIEPTNLQHDRPVLLADRMVNEILDRTFQAEPAEISGAMLGKLVRLPEPLPGTSTRIVTLLTWGLFDERHQRAINRASFDLEALAAALEIAEQRGCGETVLTMFHSHGLGSTVGNSNQPARGEQAGYRTISNLDYRLVELLFPSKATLLPIVGRKLGGSGERPVLDVYAWRGGRLRPIRYSRYRE